MCRVPQFPQLIPGLSALSGQHDPSSNVISFLYPAFCTYQQYIALHYHYIGTYYYINITSIQSRSFCIIFTFSMHQQGKSGCWLWQPGCLLLFNFCQKYICKSYSITTCAKTYNLSSHKIVINYVRALSWGISQCIMFQYLIPYQLKERMGI